MPPRFAYWTILIDNAPTAFRAKDQADLLPTLQQLRRTNPNVVLKWFAQGRLWESPEQAREARKPPPRPQEKRGREWRPGGQHRDPRMRTRPGGPGRSGPPQGSGKPDWPGRPGKPGERGRGPGGAERPRPPGGPREPGRETERARPPSGQHAKKPWERPRPHGADRDRAPRDPRHSDGRSHHGQPQRRAHDGSHRPFFRDGRAPAGRDDRRSQKAWPKREPDQRPGRPPKPEGGKKPFTKPHWHARDQRDQKGRPDQRGRSKSNWKPKPRPHDASRKPRDVDGPPRESERRTPKPPKPPDDKSGE